MVKLARKAGKQDTRPRGRGSVIHGLENSCMTSMVHFRNGTEFKL